MCINFLVYCPKGTVFLKSIDASGLTKDADTLYGIFNEVVQLIGPNYIVQFITDNETAYKSSWEKHVVKLSEPLVRVLRLTDGDEKPSMGYLYEAIDKANETIKSNLKNRLSLYMPVLRVIDARAIGQTKEALDPVSHDNTITLMFLLIGYPRRNLLLPKNI
ncbi:hypothetical protein RJ640_021977 [Escallonia rubra]|uniref:DUF659 domain-containing protein n=1 Tax=Escallonia rubra TaxID=112253 RepID=A0AA88RHM0_9ASTE|nr:hypothetical protein RJ640_021975 [Escallonia rubra]KAK2989808.1 hypothetical protein RJ640_021977 [Escallonia rubra]